MDSVIVERKHNLRQRTLRQLIGQGEEARALGQSPLFLASKTSVDLVELVVRLGLGETLERTLENDRQRAVELGDGRHDSTLERLRVGLGVLDITNTDASDLCALTTVHDYVTYRILGCAKEQITFCHNCKTLIC